MENNIKDTMEYYVDHGYIVKLCPVCLKLTKFDCPPSVKGVDGPSLSSGMFCLCNKKGPLTITPYDSNERQNAYVDYMPILCLRCKTPLYNVIDEEDGTIECTKCKLWHTVRIYS